VGADAAGVAEPCIVEHRQLFDSDSFVTAVFCKWQGAVAERCYENGVCEASLVKFGEFDEGACFAGTEERSDSFVRVGLAEESGEGGCSVVRHNGRQ